MRRAMVVLLVTLASSACGTSDPVAPTPPAPPACQTNNTATVSFENRSAGTTHTIVWDGSTVMTLGPGGKSGSPMVVAAGVTHTLSFRIANSSNLACTTSYPTLAQCTGQTYWCSY